MALYSRIISALRASAYHFLVSVLLAGLAAILVFKLWYPWPFYKMVSGRELFWLVVSVDVICGPLLTLVIWNPIKPRKELVQDLTMVACIQIAALLYGISTVAAARPVHIVFEVDRFRLVTASEIDPIDLRDAPANFQQLAWLGPTLIGVRTPKDGVELLKSVDMSMAGKDPSLRPGWWQAYSLSFPEALKRARSLTVLFETYPAKKLELDEAVQETGMSEADLLWLPLTSARDMDWIVLLDKKTGQPCSYAHIDGFF